jgi:hypothetical protein
VTRVSAVYPHAGVLIRAFDLEESFLLGFVMHLQPVIRGIKQAKKTCLPA